MQYSIRWMKFGDKSSTLIREQVFKSRAEAVKNLPKVPNIKRDRENSAYIVPISD